MTVLLCDVGRHGRLDLTFTSRRGETAIRDSYCEVPFKITRLHNSPSAGIAHLILMHCTAGLFGGDVLECAIQVEPGARVLVTQQSATKVHPAGGRRAIQRSRIRVEAGGELHIYNDPIIPFAESALSQTTLIDIDKGSRLYFWESLMAGRIGHGEAWQFDEFSSDTCLRLHGQMLYLDRFRLMPRHDPPTGEWTMARARYMATGLCFDDRTDLAERLHQLMPMAGVDEPAPGLVVARVAVDDGLNFHFCRAAFTSATLP